MNEKPMTAAQWREARKRALVQSLIYTLALCLGWWLGGRYH